jgi:dihydrodipicolinate synthase/N-acetylneuraminate lyase
MLRRDGRIVSEVENAKVLLAATVTPLRDGGAKLDEDAIPPMVEYLMANGCDGVFCSGSVGEGVLLTPAERRRVTELFREACAGTVVAHVGAQTTADTIALAEHAAAVGVDGVAVIPPPYFPLSDDALTAHMVSAALACRPTPFYLYAFRARSGYPLPPRVVARVAERADNVAGMKVSEPTFDDLRPYLELGLDILVGSEPVIPQAFAAGATGAASGLAAAFPQEVSRLVAEPTEANGRRIAELRRRLPPGGDVIAGLKASLRERGLPINPDVRLPLTMAASPVGG